MYGSGDLEKVLLMALLFDSLLLYFVLALHAVLCCLEAALTMMKEQIFSVRPKHRPCFPVVMPYAVTWLLSYEATDLVVRSRDVRTHYRDRVRLVKRLRGRRSIRISYKCQFAHVPLFVSVVSRLRLSLVSMSGA